MHFKKDLFNISIIVFFVLLLSLPFLNKAFHIDDIAYIYVARQIIKDPLHPYSFSFDWSGKSGLATFITNPPLVSYYIALVIFFFGEKESIIHFSFILFPVIAGVSMFYISKKFTKKPLGSALLLILSVSFVVMMHDVMLDIPFLAFFLLSMALFVYGVDLNNSYLLALGSIFSGFAYLTKYTGIIIIPILAAYAILKKNFRSITYLIIPILLMVLWNLYTFVIYGAPHNSEVLGWLLKSKNIFRAESLLIRLLTNVLYIGGTTIFPLMLLYPFLIDNKNKLVLTSTTIIASILSVMLFFISKNFEFAYTIPQLILFVFLFSTGLFFLFMIVRYYSKISLGLFKLNRIFHNDQNRNNIFLFLWFIIVFLFISILVGGAVRYITILTPPMIIIYINIIDDYKLLNSKKFRNFIFLALASTSLLTIFVAYADYEFAGVYRDFSEIVGQYKTSDNQVWFIGDSGFQYYMQKNGYKILGIDDNSPKEGDIIIKARIESPRKFLPLLNERLNLIGTQSYTGTLPLRVHNPKARAGFYTYGAGFLPYSLSNSSLEDFDIYKAVK